MSIRSTSVLFFAFLASTASAGETPYGSHAPTLMYWWCQAGSTSYATNPAKSTYYVSNVFENDSAKTHMSQRELGAAFWKALVAKYGIPDTHQGALCLGSPSIANANAAKADQLHQYSRSKTSTVVETGWSGG